MSALDHFLTFITSLHVIQDLPFGQRYLHLSSGQVLETPNVIRTMIPQRIVKQYVQYCDANWFLTVRIIYSATYSGRLQCNSQKDFARTRLHCSRGSQGV